MVREIGTVLDDAAALPRLTENLRPATAFSRFTRVLFGRRVVVLGCIIILALIMTAILAPVIAPYDPYAPQLDKSLLQPSREHLLGTDALGRDTFSRLVYGSRTSLMVGLIALGIACSIGMTMGLIAGYFGGLTYTLIMRFIDALMSFPTILLALVIAALLGGGIRNVMLAIGVGLLPSFTRLMCGQVLTVKENDYITALRAMGESNARIMIQHVLPNSLPPLIVQITLWMGHAILAEAGLSYLGVGIEPPGAAWGAMVHDGYQYLLSHPVLSFAPGVAIMLVVFSFNIVGDGLRDALDPRLRGVV
ncbi:MAG: ABC transporter permease [Chloroflexi bacterium]|nr:ABC transporter permease [Chloroflexota bacterium]